MSAQKWMMESQDLDCLNLMERINNLPNLLRHKPVFVDLGTSFSAEETLPLIRNMYKNIQESIEEKGIYATIPKYE